jgi:hypothetical protein
LTAPVWHQLALLDQMAATVHLHAKNFPIMIGRSSSAAAEKEGLFGDSLKGDGNHLMFAFSLQMR